METIASTPQDWFNYIARGLSSNALIQYVIRLDGEIDYALLSQAVLRSIQVEPVLGCRFQEEELQPVWTPVAFEPESLCWLVETNDIQKEIDCFLSQELDAAQEPPIKLCLIKDNKQNVIVVKLNHAVCDGAGSKYFLRLLANSYTQLCQKEAVVPAENKLPRNTQAFYEALGIQEPQSYFDPKKAELSSSWGFPVEDGETATPVFSHQLLRLGKTDFLRIRQFAKEHQYSINSVLMAAYYLALREVLTPAERANELQFTVDLRSYLPADSQQTICNLSAILNADLPTPNADFSVMVGLVEKAVKTALASDGLVHGTIGGDLAGTFGFQATADFFKADWTNILETGKCTPMISNLGRLDASPTSFGEITISDLYLVSPAFYAPAFMLGVSTYEDVLTVCASYYNPGISHEHIQKLLAIMKNYLATCC
ncbi:condensation domain-containing protein [Sunxiuqinia elliptica]|uniref:NRPS condensation-like uncharacterized protein n=1 Tax=Sunxiuqinia elliptica TaxID=655355 RepID=A0A4R6GWA9_9BACT|nr:condensation domain-containing protein [Sunxiuqinia elliptica]TDN99802.1 NRPS condensation-like uncharacterized protein [Sunxiuqinia elliptica]TDO56994.1 NRPS condensation-like uncharacterized protein [Sunxiuqinia elliptica]